LTEIIHIGALLAAEYRHNQRQAHGHFGSCHRHDKEYKHLPVELAPLVRKGHKGQVGRVQHQLDAHEDHDCITAQKYTYDAHRKKNRRQ
jgi:hypothetical protein